MSEYRPLDAVTLEYFTQHPEEIDDFLRETCANYAQDGDSTTLLSALHVIARVKGISTTHNDPAMLEEYDFSQGVRGKYAERYAEGTNMVFIAPDLVEIFPDQASVNEALRLFAAAKQVLIDK